MRETNLKEFYHWHKVPVPAREKAKQQSFGGSGNDARAILSSLELLERNHERENTASAQIGIFTRCC